MRTLSYLIICSTLFIRSARQIWILLWLSKVINKLVIFFICQYVISVCTPTLKTPPMQGASLFYLEVTVVPAIMRSKRETAPIILYLLLPVGNWDFYFVLCYF